MKVGYAVLKRFPFILVFWFLLLPMPSISAEVSLQRAQRVSSNFLAHHLALYGTWAGSSSPMITDCQLIAYMALPVAYNFKVSPSGHILVPCWDHFSPVLLYSTTSDFRPGRVNESASVESWVIPSLYYKTNEPVVDTGGSIQEVVSQSDTRVAKAWEWLGREPAEFSPDANGYGFEFSTVGPLLSTAWAQSEPYNQLCPAVPGTCSQTLVGSVATAWAQIMKYWNWPTIGNGSHSYSWKGTTLSADFNTTYDWANMPSQLTDSSSNEEKAAVAKICYHVGIAAQTNYGCDRSSSYLYADDVLDVYFKYKPSMQMRGRASHTESQWFSLFKAEFDATPPRPVAFSIVSSDGSSHEAVADGYQSGATNMVHLNFGWAGAYDGYYDITHDFTTGSETWRSDNQVIITHIEPDRPNDKLYYSNYDGYNTVIYSVDTASSDDLALAVWPEAELAGLSGSPIANAIYGADVLSQQLVSVNLSSMSFAVIGDFGSDIKELAYDCDRMILYGTDQKALYTIDTSTGIASLVGPFGSGLSVMRSLAYDRESRSLWGVDAYTDQLYRISADTAHAAAIGPTGVDSISDIFVDPSSGTIYAVGNGLYSRYLYTLDKSTGMATQVASRQISGSNALGLAAPCSLSLSAPTLTVATSGTTVTLSWNPVYNADGYILYYAPYPDVSYINSIDMGSQTGGSFVLWDGAAFYVAVKSYNSSSYSDYSNIEHFVILPSWTNSMGQTFVLIPSGTFNMGSPEDEPGRDSDETLHQVTLTKSYYLQTTEVTQAQWEAVMGNNPSFFSGCPDCPVESVSWADVQAFISKMNTLGEGTYRLPTDAEWEYACRAGSATRFYWGDDADCSKANYGNFWSLECEGINPGTTMRAGSFAPNAWGLYDMSGNVWERCQDWYSADLSSSPSTDPTGPSSGSERVDRGAGWNYWARGCRCANRAKTDPASYTPLLGFRLARDL
jgi:formylglycine-generating enzyme required for sulfatase activity